MLLERATCGTLARGESDRHFMKGRCDMLGWLGLVEIAAIEVSAAKLPLDRKATGFLVGGCDRCD